MSTNRRIISRVEQKDISSALELARGLKNDGLIEEFSISPTTLEDVYIKIVGHIEENGEPTGVTD